METSGYSTDHRRSVEPLERAPMFAYLDPATESTATSVCMKRSTSADRLADYHQWRRRTQCGNSACTTGCCCPTGADRHRRPGPRRWRFCNPLIVCPLLFALVVLSMFGAVVWRLGSLEARVADLEAQLSSAGLSPASTHTADYNRRTLDDALLVNSAAWNDTTRTPRAIQEEKCRCPSGEWAQWIPIPGADKSLVPAPARRSRGSAPDLNRPSSNALLCLRPPATQMQIRAREQDVFALSGWKSGSLLSPPPRRRRRRLRPGQAKPFEGAKLCPRLCGKEIFAQASERRRQQAPSP
uniref:Uncharacterized protein n=1 Tax=Plectus sambesii TaxID=2011161 RepID=A0A914XPR0_9BILA